MGNIQAMAKEENGANTAGGRHCEYDVALVFVFLASVQSNVASKRRTRSLPVPTYSLMTPPCSWNVVALLFAVVAQVVQGAKVDNTPPAASPPAGEGRKGVSWGTVKTHKVYVVDSGGDDNGSEVRSIFEPRTSVPSLRARR